MRTLENRHAGALVTMGSFNTGLCKLYFKNCFIIFRCVRSLLEEIFYVDVHQISF